MTEPSDPADPRRPAPPEAPSGPGVRRVQVAARPAKASRRGSLIGQGVAGLHSFFTRELWSRELASLPTFRRWGYSFARVVHLTGVNFVKDRCTWRASALTYITVLALVPMLALGFSVAKGMGAYETLLDQTINPFLDSTFGPAEGAPVDDEVAATEAPATDVADDRLEDEFAELIAAVEAADAGAEGQPPVEPQEAPGREEAAGPEGSGELEAPGEEVTAEPQTAEPRTGEQAEAPAPAGSGQDAVADPESSTPAESSEIRRAIDTVLGFVQDTNVSRLGVFGFLILLWAVIKLLGSVEHAFNDIWGVQKARSIPRKLADYFSTIILVPLLLIVGTGVLGMARSERVDDFLGLGGDSPIVALLGSLAVVWVAFTVAYVVMPNTRIRLSSAIVGGIVGGTMWQLFQWAHLKLQIGVANYNAIYSTFAALPIFLFWIQSSWMTVLLGAEAASAHQNQARYGQIVRSRDYDLALKEVVALRLAVRVTRTFLSGHPPMHTDELADALGCPDRTLQEVAHGLEQAHVLASVEGDHEEPALVLASDPEHVRMQDVLDALKGDSLQDSTREAFRAVDDQDAVVDRAFERFRDARDASGTNLTLRELAATKFAATDDRKKLSAS